MTAIDLGNIRINWKGAYDATTAYVLNDAVAYKGSSYVAKRNVTGVTPVQGDDWDLMAAGTDQMTTEGDMLIHDGTNPVRLPKGKNAQILQMNKGRPAWINPSLDPSLRVWKLAKVNGMGGWHCRVYLMADGTIKACGYGGNYTNGNPNGSHTWVPTRVSTYDPSIRFVEVFSGGMYHYGLTAEGDVWSWGHNNYGQLGHGNTTSIAIAKRIEFFKTNKIKIAKVIPARPNYHDYGCTLFLTTTGKVYGVGYNNEGQLGNGTTSNQYTPVRCGAVTDIKDVVISGLPHTVFAVQKNGSLWVWGWNGSGQLGLGDNSNRVSPSLHATMTNVKKAIPSCGYTTSGSSPTGHGLVLRNDGTLWTTGYNGYGQLGHGDTTSRKSFTQITHSSTFTDIICGDGRYACVAAITDGKELYLWGHNSYGILGDGTTTQRKTPYKPNTTFQGKVKKVIIAGGSNYEGCIVEADNELWAAGYADNANLGNGYDRGNNKTFLRVLGQTGDIAHWDCFGQGTSAWGIGVLYTDGRVDACGENNSYGECGTHVDNLHDVRVLTNVLF